MDVVLGGLAIMLVGRLSPEARPEQLWALLLVWLLTVALSGGYRATAAKRIQSLKPLVVAALALIVGVSLVSYAVSAPLARPALLAGLPALVTVAAATRLVALRLPTAVGLVSAPQRVLLVGAEHEVSTWVRRGLATEGFAAGDIVGAVLPEGARAADLPVELDDKPVFIGLDRISCAAELASADTVLVAAGHTSGHALRRLAVSLQHRKVDLVLAVDLVEVDAHRVSLEVVDGVPLVRVAPPRLLGKTPMLKDVLDRVGAAALLLLAMPLFGVIALILKISDPGPLLFSHQRLGRLGKPFGMYKFRTMKSQYSGRPALDVFAEMDRPDLVAEFLRDRKVHDDPRVTRIGRLLRRTSLDELPQLLNVLRGELSLVGPRPIVSEELELFGESSSRILLCKPGITGLWQVSGRNSLPYHERVRLNLYYVDNWRMSLDLRLLLRTVRVVLNRRGAY